MKTIEIAQVCHEANRAYCAVLGDASQAEWEHAPSWQKDSAVQGVMYALDNLNAQPQDSHNSWLAVKTAEGWTYGPEKNVDLKEHPCFRPYDELPDAQKAKDRLFLGVVRALSLDGVSGLEQQAQDGALPQAGQSGAQPGAYTPPLAGGELNAAIAATPGDKVTKDQIDAAIVDVTFVQIGLTVTVCSITLFNGFSVRGESACVDPANFDADIGRTIAHDDAYRKLWAFFGFLLAEKRYQASLASHLALASKASQAAS